KRDHSPKAVEKSTAVVHYRPIQQINKSTIQLIAVLPLSATHFAFTLIRRVRQIFLRQVIFILLLILLYILSRSRLLFFLWLLFAFGNLGHIRPPGFLLLAGIGGVLIL